MRDRSFAWLLASAIPLSAAAALQPGQRAPGFTTQASFTARHSRFP